MLIKFVATAIFLSFTNQIIESAVRVTMERTSMTLYDSSVIGKYNTSVRRPNRTSTYMVYLYADLLMPWNYNVTMDITTYEYRSNVYKESIIRVVDMDFCKIMDKDTWIMPIFRTYSNIPKHCPFRDAFLMSNGYIPDNTLPTAFPQGKWRFDIKLKSTKKNKFFMLFQLYFRVEHTIEKRNKPKKKSFV